MKKTELNIPGILKAVESDSTSDYTGRSELFTFKQRPVKYLEIYGKDKKAVIYFYDGTVSAVYLMDTNEVRGVVINNNIDDNVLFDFVKKFKELGGERMEYAPNTGTLLYGNTVEKVIVTDKKYELRMKNGAFSERYLV